MRTHKPRRPHRRPSVRRTARQFGQRGIGRRNRPGALNPAAKEIQLLQEQLQAGEIDSDEFESRMEELEARSRHSDVQHTIARARRNAARRAATRMAARRNAAIDPADVVLLNNAIKQLSKAQDADQAVRMLRDIIDASKEMMQELGGGKSATVHASMPREDFQVELNMMIASATRVARNSEEAKDGGMTQRGYMGTVDRDVALMGQIVEEVYETLTDEEHNYSRFPSPITYGR